MQTDPRLRAETIAGESLGSVIQKESLLQLEDRMQAATEILRTLEAEDRVLRRAAHFLPVAMPTLIVRVDQSCINEAIERHAALRMRRNSKGAGKRDHE